jgi:serine/threonine protein phosphatase PrpC
MNASARNGPAPAASNRLRLAGAMLSDVGRVRSHNEDSVAFVLPSDEAAAGGADTLLLVADGMGGHAAGHVASAFAAEIVRRVVLEVKSAVPNVLSAAFTAANNAILQYAGEHPEFSGMGTTCTALVVRGGSAFLAHVGDSRAYLLRDGALKQLSEDQTLVRRLVKNGTLTEEEARTSEVSNVLLQALGTSQDLEPEIWVEGLPLMPNDTIILCSDGLHGLVADATIAEIAGRHEPLEAAETLISRALEAGGHDNVSVGVFRAVDAAGPRASSERATRPVSTHERPQ